MFFVFALMNFTISSAALPVPAPPEVAAKNYLLIDFASGKVLAEKNADAPSITIANIVKSPEVSVGGLNDIKDNEDLSRYIL